MAERVTLLDAGDIFAQKPATRITDVWQPHPGPQSQFMQADAYEVLYGGAAGGGKTDALLYDLLADIHHPKSRVLFLRRTYVELREVMDRALLTFAQLGGVWNASEKRWRFPSGATYEFGYCESYADVLRYQGQEYSRIGFDELGQCPEERIWTYLMSRNRTTAKDLRRAMRASANPGGPGHIWLKKRYVLPCGEHGETVYTEPSSGLTRAFIPARLTDNPALTTNDPDYAKRLELLPEVTRRQLLDGDWNAGEGLALDELSRSIHLIPPFDIPAHWYCWGAFDWGFNHPFAFGWFAMSSDADVYLVDSVHGRRLYPPEIVERIKDAIPTDRLRFTTAGHDCWNEVKARGESTPSIAEQFMKSGLSLKKANISRVTGLNNMRRYITHRATGRPRFFVLDTPNNRRTFDILESMVTDPDHPEDALKMDADDLGYGGDDPYDMVRYGLAERPIAKAEPLKDWNASSPEALQAEYEQKYTHRGREQRKKLKIKGVNDPSFGRF